MSFLKWLKAGDKKILETKNPIEDVDDDEERRRDEEGRDTGRTNEEEEARQNDGTKIVYYSYSTPNDNIVNALQSQKKDLQVR
jgi:hypothetical protein